MRRYGRAPLGLLGLALIAACTARPGTGPALDAALAEALAHARYVYIASERPDGSLGAPAEIWFMVHDGAVWVGSAKTSWRAKRIAAGRTRASIAVGTRDGRAFDARGAFVTDPALYERLFEQFAIKYADGWPKWEQRFRDGLTSGAMALIRYQPAG